MNKSNRYFWASALAGSLVVLGLLTLVLKNFYSAYQTVLQWCGLSAEDCRKVLDQVSPLGIVAGAGLLWVGVVGAVELWQTGRYVYRVKARRLQVPKSLNNLALRLGIPGRIVLVKGDVLFCSGFVHPTIVLGSGVLNRLSVRELEAALVHESYHLQNRDPLKVLLATTLGRGLFFLPAVAELAKRYLSEKELAADNLAISRVGKIYLARALYKVLSRHDSDALTVAVAGFAAERSRVFRLLGLTDRTYFYSRTWVFSAALLMLTVLSFFYHPVVASAGCL